MAADWGFYYTFTTTMKRLDAEAAADFAVEAISLFGSRIAEVLTAVERAPKGTGWKQRARIGTRVKWYQEVAEKGQTF